MKHFLTISFFLICTDSWAAQIKVTKEFCDQYLVESIPDADVAYKPDDSNMGPPVDVGGSITVKPPKSMDIFVDLNMGKYHKGHNINPNSNKHRNKYLKDMGVDITVNDDGRIYMGDQPLFHEDEVALKEACRKLKSK